MRCLKSFKFIPRTGSVTARAGDDDLGFDTIFEIGKSTPAERALRRAAVFEQALKEAESRLPEGWIKKKSPHFHAFSHADDRYTTRTLDQAEAMVSWLSQNFGWVGDGLPGPAMLRICKDWDEYSAFVRRSSDAWFVNSFEVSAYKDTAGWGFGSSSLYTGIANIWFADKNPRFRWGMPPWMAIGLSQVFGGANVKGGKVEFKLDQWDRDMLREVRRKGALSTARDLFLADFAGLQKMERSWIQCGTLLRFLWTGPKAAQTKELFKKYLQAHLAVVDEEEKEWDAASKAKEGKDKKEKTEEEKEKEEEERFKARQQGEKKRLEKIFQLAFGEWSEADWTAFEHAYASFAE